LIRVGQMKNIRVVSGPFWVDLLVTAYSLP